MIESVFRRITRVGIKGLLGVVVALAVALFTLFARAILVLIPQSILSRCDFQRSKRFFPGLRLFRGFHDEAQPSTIDMSTYELIRHAGYAAEEHTVYTEDGYLLTYHRIPRGKNESESKQPRPPVFLMHGLMQCNEAWVCYDDSLAFVLADAGFDVWLGNNRGNKYGFKHRVYKPSDCKFWNFSLDEFARYDVPAGIDYILAKTGMKSLTYIGFSQGSAQAFACFSTLHNVAAKVNLFIALSPAAKAEGLTRGMLSTFIKMAPQIIFLLFGTGAMWSSIFLWRTLLTPAMFANSIDVCCRQLFAWNMNNIGTMQRKMLLYYHLYSYTSVKNVVHWFQIVAQNRFQQYDDTDRLVRNKYEDVAPHTYPISQIECPVAIIYGEIDYLPDMKWILENVPKGTFVKSIANYEHLDTVWAQDAGKKVYPDVLQLLRVASETSVLSRQTSKNDKLRATSLEQHVLIAPCEHE